ncbi:MULTISPECIES: hypothetical protein [Proteus]|uniref:hypothetical protein n=1 Tax=Proteus TaxID=583 RepID=UPI001378E1AE|nr:hypothetical protein [Proteus sp. G2626]NBN44404.1 hypothetical protein [Proteus sp. G2626]
MNFYKLRKEIKKTKILEDKITLCELYANLMMGSQYDLSEIIELEKEVISSFEFIISEHEYLSLGDKKNICHVISTPYLEGGHTRLCENIAEMDNKEDANLFITRSVKNSVLIRLNNYFTAIEIAEAVAPIEKIKEIISHLSKFNNLVLYIHPDDILTVIAVGLLKKTYKNINVFFINHADHLFFFGRSVIDLMFLISYRGYEVEKSNKNISYKLSFIGIPIETKNEPALTYNVKKILIAGSSYKMKPNRTVSIQNEIENYLNENIHSQLIAIGVKSTDYWWWRVKIKHWNRIKLYDSLNYSRYMSLLKECDTCIDTAPTTGGTAFAEMYLNGLRPLAIYSGIYGYTPLDSIRGKTLKESESKGKLVFNDLYKELELVHGKNNVKKRYKDGLNFNCHEIPSCLSKLNNDLKMYSSNHRKVISKNLLKKLFFSSTLGIYEKVHFFIFDFDCLGFINYYLIKILKLNKKKIR